MPFKARMVQAFGTEFGTERNRPGFNSLPDRTMVRMARSYLGFLSTMDAMEPHTIG